MLIHKKKCLTLCLKTNKTTNIKPNTFVHLVLQTFSHLCALLILEFSCLNNSKITNIKIIKTKSCNYLTKYFCTLFDPILNNKTIFTS